MPSIKAVRFLAVSAAAACAAVTAVAAHAAAAGHAAGQDTARHGTVAPQQARVVRPPRIFPAATAGFLWSTSATPSGPIDPFYAFNSTNAAITVTTLGTGQYLVTFAGLGAIRKPALELTSYGSPATCSVAFANPSGGAWVVGVTCFSLSGSPQDALFDLMITQPKMQPSGVLDYGLADRPGKLLFPYNSSVKTNRVRLLGNGRYRVTMPGPRTRGTTGTVKVTALGDAGGDCAVAGWHGTGTGQVIGVDCFAASGARQNRQFMVTYVRGNNPMGLNGATTANAYADRPSAGRYRPRTQYDSALHARVIITRFAVGQYKVFFNGSHGLGGNGGDVQVGAAGGAADHCYVVNWAAVATNPYAYVNCVSNQGVLTDSPFTIEWAVA